MNTREQFGDYLLLKKLSEDPLGESFRAGRLTSKGMDQVVLLRVFNGPGIDHGRLWQAISGRGEVHKVLSSPNIGAGVALGQVRNVPYVAYEYVSGKNLASLLEQAIKRRHPVPSDHALLVAERVALALAVGYESRVGQERVLHGALVPQLIMISNEGETRVLGFEAAPGLRQVLASGTHPLRRYLPPEGRAGEPIHKADDVFSLGAILLELLTGRPLPEDEASIAQAIGGVELQPDGSPLPSELKQLLLQSLTARSQRIADAISWHKTVSKLMFEAQFSPTTFNLAFYMHNLFRDDIERESQEIEVERTMEIPVAALAGAQAPAPTQGQQPAASDVREDTGVREDTDVIRDRYGIDAEAGASRKKLLVGGAVAAVLLLGLGVGGFFMLRPSDRDPAPREQVAAAAAAPSPDVEAAQLAAERASAAEEEQRLLEQRIAEMVDQRLEATSAQYEQDLARLQTELETQRRRVAEAQEAQRAAQVEAEARLAQAQAAEARPEPPPGPERVAERSDPPTSEPEEEPAASRPAAAPSAAPSAEEPAAPPAGDQVASLQPETAEAPAASPPPMEPPAAEPPRATRYRPGDLVEQGTPGLIPPRRIDMRQPTYPPQARRLGREGTVVVRVLVNERGQVIETEVDGEEAGFGMDQAALASARTARYHPGTVEGVPVKVWVTLTFPFRL